MAKQASQSDPDKYSDPALRDRIKEKVMAGDKGGKPGQWSARKAQMVAHEYEAEGGSYKHGPDEQQQSLRKWGDEQWHTADGAKAVHEDGSTSRYLPDAAWKELSPEEKAATERKKRDGSRAGKQFVANTGEAAEARKHATGGPEPAQKKGAPAKAGTKRAQPAGAKSAPRKASAKKAAAGGKRSPAKASAKKPKPAARQSPAKKSSG